MELNKLVYNFGTKLSEGSSKDNNLLGGKGANLAEMSKLGLPVPPGFTITTEVCTYFYNNNNSLPESLNTSVDEGIKFIEKLTQMKFADYNNPLLLSIRSGSRASMPGMMDTVLNLGLNEDTVKGLSELTKNEKFAFDSYRRFIQMYSDVVLNIDFSIFEDALEDLKNENNIIQDTDLNVVHLKKLVEVYKNIVKRETSKMFPSDPYEQLWGSIKAVFESWMNKRAITYRNLNNIPSEWGTAVNIQSMVFGNMGENSATGVSFTRNPNNGKNTFYGEYLINAQGEDVVAGIRTPHQISSSNYNGENKKLSLENTMPKIYEELNNIRFILEQHYKEMQDIEFTVQEGKLFLLQTRNGKRTAEAAIKIAVDMVAEGIIDKKQALLRIDPELINQILHPTLDRKSKVDFLLRGMPASPGAASGIIVFNSNEAEKIASSGKNVILVRSETSPEDIGGMHASKGILTSRGGMTSHAAVVARGMGRACITGANELRINEKEKFAFFGDKKLSYGQDITLDGSTGDVFLGIVPTKYPELSEEFNVLMKWADNERRLKIRANAETITDAKTSLKFGAEGIGLCRTEHMFFDKNRINVMRQMILAENQPMREKALNKLLPMQRDDFIELFNIMKGMPVTIRLLDPPLHEFLPTNEEEMVLVAKESNIDISVAKNQAIKLTETNPMLGHRGCRLAISYPEIYSMQTSAIIEAAIICQKTSNEKINVEIMIPLASSAKEVIYCKSIIKESAEKVFEKYGSKVKYKVGTMIELPKAALSAKEIAHEVDFFSYGTNDLTQTVFGISRDDAGLFLKTYVEKNIFKNDPFTSIDQDSVGYLVKCATENGRKSNNNIKTGICGEHGGDPESISFFEQIGLDYVSASPFRVPIARLAAAQAKIKLNL